MVEKKREPETPTSRRRPWAVLGIGGLVVIAAAIAVVIVLGIIAFVQNYYADSKADDKARHDFANLRADEAERATHGGIKVNRHSYEWTGVDYLTVRVDLGVCLGLPATINTPDRPKKIEDVGQLILEVPSIDQWSRTNATVSGTTPNLGKILDASGWAHCVAGDNRFDRMSP